MDTERNIPIDEEDAIDNGEIKIQVIKVGDTLPNLLECIQIPSLDNDEVDE